MTDKPKEREKRCKYWVRDILARTHVCDKPKHGWCCLYSGNGSVCHYSPDYEPDSPDNKGAKERDDE